MAQDKKKKNRMSMYNMLKHDNGDYWRHYLYLKFFIQSIDRKYERFDENYFCNNGTVDFCSNDLRAQMGADINDEKFQAVVGLKLQYLKRVEVSENSNIVQFEDRINELQKKRVPDKTVAHQRRAYMAFKAVSAVLLPVLAVTELCLVTLAPFIPFLVLPASILTGVMAVAGVFKVITVGCLVTSLGFKFKYDKNRHKNSDLDLKIDHLKEKSRRADRNVKRGRFLHNVLQKAVFENKPAAQNRAYKNGFAQFFRPPGLGANPIKPAAGKKNHKNRPQAHDADDVANILLLA